MGREVGRHVLYLLKSLEHPSWLGGFERQREPKRASWEPKFGEISYMSPEPNVFPELSYNMSPELSSFEITAPPIGKSSDSKRTHSLSFLKLRRSVNGFTDVGCCFGEDGSYEMPGT